MESLGWAVFGFILATGISCSNKNNYSKPEQRFTKKVQSPATNPKENANDPKDPVLPTEPGPSPEPPQQQQKVTAPNSSKEEELRSKEELFPSEKKEDDNRSINQIFCEDGPKILDLVSQADFSKEMSILCTDGEASSIMTDADNNAYEGVAHTLTLQNITGGFGNKSGDLVQ